MLNMCLLTIVMGFCVIGIYFTVKEITSLFLKNYAKSCVVIDVTDCCVDIENQARLALLSNPKSSIVLVDRCNDEEIKSILYRLCEECERIHIQ